MTASTSQAALTVNTPDGRCASSPAKPNVEPAQRVRRSIQPTDPPVTNTAEPVISGTIHVGSTLTTSGGTWNPADVTKSYQWLRSGSPITNATAVGYTLVAADQNQLISVRVTATKPGYTAATATSQAVGPITGDGEPAVYRPDGPVKRAGTTSYLGRGVYNRTGAYQTLRDTVRRGERRTYSFRVENDGNRSDFSWLVGTGAGQGFTTRYFAGSVDITSDVVSGNYRTPDLMPGDNIAYKVVAKATSNVAADTVRSGGPRHDQGRPGSVERLPRDAAGKSPVWHPHRQRHRRLTGDAQDNRLGVEGCAFRILS